VVLEKMAEYREALQNPGIDVEQKIKILDELLDKEPATEIIKSSKIGKVIRKLAANSNEGSKFDMTKSYQDRFFKLWPARARWGSSKVSCLVSALTVK